MNQLHEMYLAAAVDARRASLADEARAARVAKEAQASRPSVGQKARSRRWRVLVPRRALRLA